MVVVLAVGVLAVAGIAYSGIVRAGAADLDQALLREVEAYTAAIAPVSAEDGRGLVDASRAYLGGRSAEGGVASILIVSFTDGRVLSNSSIDLENAADSTPLLEAATARRGFFDLGYQGLGYRAATAPVSSADGDVLAVFMAAAPTSALDRLSAEYAASFALAAVLVVLAGAALSVWIARRALAPLAAMASSASSITHATLAEERVAYAGPPDELGELADALNAMLDRLERSFEDQRRFVADASHELRTPVAVVRGNLDLLRQEGIDAESREEALRIVDDEVSRMQRLLDDLLSLAAAQSPSRRPFQPLSMSALVMETAARARALGDREIRHRCERDPWVAGDPDLLEQALLNLVRNAIQHTATGDTIEIACGLENGRALLAVSDNGPGIPPEDVDRVFDRFYRGGGERPEAGGGAGLGLAIARRLVEAHGGTIGVSNQASGGARFVIELPAIEAPGDAGEVAI